MLSEKWVPQRWAIGKGVAKLAVDLDFEVNTSRIGHGRQEGEGLIHLVLESFPRSSRLRLTLVTPCSAASGHLARNQASTRQILTLILTPILLVIIALILTFSSPYPVSHSLKSRLNVTYEHEDGCAANADENVKFPLLHRLFSFICFDLFLNESLHRGYHWNWS